MNRKRTEILMGWLLKISASLTVLVTISIIWVLLYEAVMFFRQVPITQFLTGTEWTPLFADKKFGILPLLSATLLTSFIALLVALPMGLITAIYLSEYANPVLRNIIKPILELLASIPTVVYGFFALTVVTPFLQSFI
ncbi:MAG: PstC family ABC transporter permease, partial [Bacteroidales bacterium]